MAKQINTPVSTASSKGTVTQVIGEVKVTTASGETRVLQVGDKINIGDTIQTGANGAVAIAFEGAGQMSLGHSDSLTMTAELLANILKPAASAADDAAKIQELIAQGADPTQVAAASAAGAGGDEDAGHSVVVLDTPSSRVDIETGFPTEGISVSGLNVNVDPNSANLPPNALADTSSAINPDGTINTADAADDGLTVQANSVLEITTDRLLVNDTDPNGDPLTIIGVGAATNGTAVLNADGSITYTPNTNYSGSDTFTYTVSDGRGGTATATVTIGVIPPQVVLANFLSDGNEVVSLAEDPVNPLTGNVLANTVNPNDTPAPASVTSFSWGTETSAAGGSIAIIGIGTLSIASDGSYSFTPVSNFNGSVPVVNYVVSDGELSDGSTLTISVTPVNDAPLANAANGVNDSNWVQDVSENFNEQEDSIQNVAPSTSGNVLLTIDHTTGAPSGSFSDLADTDVDGDPLSVKNIQSTVGGSVVVAAVGDTTIAGEYGTLTIHADGSYSYTLNYNNGAVNALDDDSAPLTDTFTYTVTDGDLDDSENLVISIFGTNDGPVANNDAQGTPDTNWVQDVVALDESETAPAASGNVLLDQAHNGVFGNFSDKADVDVDGDPLSVKNIQSTVGGSVVVAAVGDTAIAGEYGTLTIHADGSYSYTLNYNNTAVNALDDDSTPLTDTFTYTVTDGDLDDSENLVISIFGSNDGPVANNGAQGTPDTNWVQDVVALDESETAPTASGNVLLDQAHNGVFGNFSDKADVDVDGDPLSVKNIQSTVGGSVAVAAVGDTAIAGEYGTLTIHADGSYSYTLNYNNGAVNALDDDSAPLTDTFTYTVTDGDLDDSENL
ncbi:retention module-containing protein, partial [Deefgea rivuli]|uniref:retention module-containing protein n=1 Tax=Deefgea rivuli TaxID=400948 RepID=UPI0004831855